MSCTNKTVLVNLVLDVLLVAPSSGNTGRKRRKQL